MPTACHAQRGRTRCLEALKAEFVKHILQNITERLFLRLRNDYNTAHRDNYLMLYVLLIYGFNRMIRFNSRGNYNLPVGNVDFNSNTVEALNSYFYVNASKQTSWHAIDFEDF